MEITVDLEHRTLKVAAKSTRLLNLSHITIHNSKNTRNYELSPRQGYRPKEQRKLIVIKIMLFIM